jgi:hypothetical protein
VKANTVTPKCRCGAHLHQAGPVTQAGYVTDGGTRHEKSWCCSWCALGQGCLCCEWTAPVLTPRLDSLLDRLEGRTA